MINLSHKIHGAATLIITVILLFTITFIVLFAGNYSLFQQKMTSNQYRNDMAYQAAEAGLEFAIPYLLQNRTTILANPSGGFIAAYADTNTANVTLANNSRYTIVYTNPVANDYTLIKITVTGVSDDGSSTKTLSQLVKYGGMLANVPTTPMISQGDVTMTGSAQITNTITNTTISTGGTVTLGGSSRTVTSSGVSSTASSIQSDVTQNSSALNTITPSQLFQNYFGSNSTVYKSQVANYYTNSSNTNYSTTLNGKTGTTIWIDQTGGEARLTGSAVIGSPSAPVILIVNGNLFLSGSSIIYGLVFQMGGTTATDVTGSVQINGGFITTGAVSITGSININYSDTVLTNLQQQSAYYAKVGGSWKDF